MIYRETFRSPRNLLLLSAVGFVALLVVSQQFGADVSRTRKALYLSYAEKQLLDFTFFEEVSAIAERFTFGTPYSTKYSVNYIGESKENIAILLIDMRNTPEKDLTQELPFYEEVRYQCITIPVQRLILCDSSMLDAIPATPPVVLDDGSQLQAPLLRQWIIGHEIAHIVLGRASCTRS